MNRKKGITKFIDTKKLTIKLTPPHPQNNNKTKK